MTHTSAMQKAREVERFEFSERHGEHIPYLDGAWVRHSDYATLESENASLRKKVEEMEAARSRGVLDYAAIGQKWADEIARATRAEAEAAALRKALEKPAPEVVAEVQAALMKHPFFRGNAATAFGFANTAIGALAHATLTQEPGNAA